MLPLNAIEEGNFPPHSTYSEVEVAADLRVLSSFLHFIGGRGVLLPPPKKCGSGGELFFKTISYIFIYLFVYVYTYAMQYDAH
jgi:hypothetical protein